MCFLILVWSYWNVFSHFLHISVCKLESGSDLRGRARRKLPFQCSRGNPCADLVIPEKSATVCHARFVGIQSQSTCSSQWPISVNLLAQTAAKIHFLVLIGVYYSYFRLLNTSCIFFMLCAWISTKFVKQWRVHAQLGVCYLLLQAPAQGTRSRNSWNSDVLACSWVWNFCRVLRKNPWDRFSSSCIGTW